MPHIRFILPLTALFFGSCTTFFEPELAKLADEPLSAEPRVRAVAPWHYYDHAGQLISTQHFQIHTTMDDPIFQHMLVRVLEAAHDRNAAQTHFQYDKPLECYVFSTRGQWETYTKEHGGANAAIYLQISSGGYCQQGVFAGYDIGRDRTLSVIAHETWHQYSWFAFKDRLPSWLEEGLATQNEAIVWDHAQPVFLPEKNSGRKAALRQAVHTGSLFKLPDLLSTHAGRVIKMSQSSIDAYYAQLWSFTLFLESSPLYAQRLRRLVADAATGTLVQALDGTSVTPQEIQNYTEHWNTVAGPVYLEKYISRDLDPLEHDYHLWLQQFLRDN